MRERLRRIWLPGLLATLIAYTGQLVIYRYLLPPRIFHHGSAMFVVSYPWLVLLVACGAFVTWLSYHEGGSPRERLFVSQIPVIVMLAVLVLSGMAAVFDSGVSAVVRLQSFLGFFCCSVVLPSMALLIGATPMIACEQLGQDTEIEAKA